MSERQDHGYRDEVGAAIERLEKLAEENAQLRAELERLERPKRSRAARSRSAGACVLLFGAMFAMTAGALARGLSCPHRRASHTLSPQLTPRTHEFRTIRNGDDCSLPYYYDRNNVRRWKPSCLAE